MRASSSLAQKWWHFLELPKVISFASRASFTVCTLPLGENRSDHAGVVAFEETAWALSTAQGKQQGSHRSCAIHAAWCCVAVVADVKCVAVGKGCSRHQGELGEVVSRPGHQVGQHVLWRGIKGRQRKVQGVRLMQGSMHVCLKQACRGSCACMHACMVHAYKQACMVHAYKQACMVHAYKHVCKGAWCIHACNACMEHASCMLHGTHWQHPRAACITLTALLL